MEIWFPSLKPVEIEFAFSLEMVTDYKFCSLYKNHLQAVDSVSKVEMHILQMY